VWREGRVVWLSPDQIPVASDDSSEARPGKGSADSS
jgi:hypothetical protein